MKYLLYLLVAAAVNALLFPLLALLLGASDAVALIIVLTPLSLWTARLIVAIRRGRITRRMPMLDGGRVMAGLFWSFNPEVYERRPGFDNFKGYVFKESMCCLLLWILFLSAPLAQALDGLGR